MTLIKSASVPSTIKGLVHDKYKPLPIISTFKAAPSTVTPDNSVLILPNIVSNVTAVSASNGVGAGLTNLTSALSVAVS